MERKTPTELVRKLLGVALATRNQVRQALIERGHDLYTSHTAVIPNLPEGGLRLSELAERLGYSVQRAAQVVKQLQRAGYVELSADESDRRAKRVRYSARGHRLLRDSHEIHSEIWRDFAEQVGAQQAERVASSIRTLHEVFVGPGRALLLEPRARPRRRKRLRRS
jgi:DNA-binding MarR family transcriptional regulator